MTEPQQPVKESAPAAPPANREGWDAPLDSPEQRRAAVEAAFDYRGDVTVQTSDDQTFEGYMFDRHLDHDPPTVRMMLAEDGRRRTIPVAAITRLTFSGRDPAAGQSWETWVKKYVKKKMEEHKASEGAE